jgi:hypothetical protein
MSFGENSSDWIKVFGVVVALIIGAGLVMPFTLQPSDQPAPSPTPGITITLPITPAPTPKLTPRPTPRITPVPPWDRSTPLPTPTGTPSPSSTPHLRYCDETGCHDGIAPTPTPSPTPTPIPTPSPTPQPRWVAAGMKCAVPDSLLGERWIVAYKFDCTCNIQAGGASWGKLGPLFSPFEGCQSNSAWRDASCTCVNEICAASSGLC